MKVLILLQLASLSLFANQGNSIDLETINNKALKNALSQAFEEDMPAPHHAVPGTTESYTTSVHSEATLRSFPANVSSFRMAVFEKRSRIEEKNNSYVKLPEMAQFNNPEIYQFNVQALSLIHI